MRVDQKIRLQCIYFTLSVLNTNENSSGLIVLLFYFLPHVVSAVVEIPVTPRYEFLFIVDSRPYLVLSATLIILGL